ncbi:hypothetical protein GW17_00047946 [Ensete ventricosum]|nr:hypothetical protein GW17_00047946 [Ensete ventricosum]
MKLKSANEARLNLGIGSSSNDAVGFCREFARRFIEWIEKFTGNTLEDRRNKTGRLTVRILEATGLAGISEGKPSVRDDWTARTLEIERLLVAVSG